MKAIRPENMATYRQTLRLREAEAQQQRQQRWQAAWGVARQGGDILKQEFRAIQVIVFGSLLHPEWFSMTSDIDLAVAGLSAWDHLAAIAQMQDLSDFKVDVIRLETCPPRLRGVIEAEGQEL
ncbi:nucleotidyltransferase family protein [Halomicronema hongdechloris]|uniref:nucleotidyltransferase family protein n=1 Tax=Halomicronema hongdechloris TaxID=1209493 RepID=UPI0009BB15EC|nr:nucleotidyltransferase domain-containing protein [Halomicronema hongdechloris]